MSRVFIKVFVDVLSALYTDSLEGNICGFDSHRSHGSQGLGSPNLSTAVQPGDEVFWTAISLECEAHLVITRAEFTSPDFLAVPTKGNGWGVLQMTVPEISSPVPYSLNFTFGNNGKTMQYSRGFSLRPIEVHNG